MSKEELIHYVEMLPRDELDELAEHIDSLRLPENDDELSPEHRAILEERLAEFERDGDRGEPLELVVERIRASLKK